jgi:hypothetical protein
MQPHDADQRQLALKAVKSLEGEGASPTSAALMTLPHWMEKVVEKEVARITAKCQRYSATRNGKGLSALGKAWDGRTLLTRRAAGASGADVARRVRGEGCAAH